MPPPRSLIPRWSVFWTRQLTSRHARQHVFAATRACSCSAPQKLQETVDATTANPPTPPIDHRTLAQAHDLFITSQYSPGSPLLLPNGAYVFQKLQAFLRAQYPQFGFQEVVTPTIYKKSLWETSGHWDNYADDMFSVRGRGATGRAEEAQIGEDEEFGLKPMNCPGHCLLFRNKVRSYRELPVRYADFSALHRNEVSGALTGLTRVRRFHQDDAHIFCRPDQILDEIEQTLKFVGVVYDTFGLGPYKLLLSTRPKDHFIGAVEEWDRAEQQLTSALDNSGREWELNEGDGAFYGPKIDIILKDSNGKEHQTATIQLDFQLPQRFDLQYQASPEELGQVRPQDERLVDPAHRRPVIVHRAIYGSLERFMALLIEHYAGTYPFWLSPRPAIILPMNRNNDVLDHAAHIQSSLAGLLSPAHLASRTAHVLGKTTPEPLSTIQLPIDIDTSGRPLGKKIAIAQTKRYNHIVVVGRSEVENQNLKLEVVNQPNIDSTTDVLSGVLGRPLEANEKVRGKVAVNMDVSQARTYFERLANMYL